MSTQDLQEPSPPGQAPLSVLELGQETVPRGVSRPRRAFAQGTPKRVWATPEWKEDGADAQEPQGPARRSWSKPGLGN